MQIINDKKIKTFKDLQNTFYTIYQKANRHYYLTIQKESEQYATIFEGTKNKIFKKLQEYHKNNKFIDIE